MFIETDDEEKKKRYEFIFDMMGGFFKKFDPDEVVSVMLHIASTRYIFEDKGIKEFLSDCAALFQTLENKDGERIRTKKAEIMQRLDKELSEAVEKVKKHYEEGCNE